MLVRLGASRRSAVTNGNRPFVREGGDARSAWVRRWRDLALMHANDW
jgi:hypothetical protein